MQQIVSVWSALSLRRRIVVVGATIAMFAAVLGLSRMAAQPSMELLYAGLEPGAAGDVVAALDQRGVAYDVRQGSIFVDSAQRDALRMTLASEGLPANNGQGYEILEGLTGFGTTSQMFDAAYWRAKEGELARTITASPKIKAARVHISNPSSNPFQRDIRPTASVTVTGQSGNIAQPQAMAFKFLVASAVAGLAPEDVSIIDGRNGVVVAGDDPAAGTGSVNERAVELRRNIQRLLEARVGIGNAVVEVSVETVTEREAIVERRFDPESRVAISSETEERSNSSSGSQAGGVTVASNLPEGDATSGDSTSRSENSESRERINYEVAETTREVLRTPGAIKRVSVAVLVDGIRVPDAATGAETWEPRPEAEMEALRELVASAVGFDEARGDTITLKSMEFVPLGELPPEPDPSLFSAMQLDTMALIQVAVLAVVALALGLFVVRPILAARPQPATAALAPPPAEAAGIPLAQMTAETGSGRPDSRSGARIEPRTEALTGEIEDPAAPVPQMAVVGGEREAPALPADAEPGADPVQRLRALIEDRREESVEILRSWLEDEEEKA